MYWYLSFLRPPPVSLAVPSDGVVITPQVANDLRTELRDEPTEISYTWQRTHPAPSAPTRPQPLTTFAPPASTYRPLTVPLPKAARAGERWRLGLVSPPASRPEATTLLALSGGDPGVLGVWSEGIVLTPGGVLAADSGAVRGVGAAKGGKDKDNKGGKKSSGKGGKDEKAGGKDKGKGKDDGPKQTRITREWPAPRGALKVVEQTSFDLDKKVWDSGLALASWLWRHMAAGDGSKSSAAASGSALHADAARVLDRLGAARVVELGSGTGLVSIALAQIRETGGGGAEITATDLDSAMEIMAENIAVNGAQVTPSVLDWDAPLPEWVGASWPDMIVAADVTYNTSSFPALVATLERLLPTNPANGKHPLLLLAYKQRDVAERDLWGMLNERGIGMVLVDRVRGAEEEGQVEVWVGGRDVKA